MMSILGGGTTKPDESTDRLRECDSDKGAAPGVGVGWLKKSEIFSNVICTST